MKKFFKYTGFLLLLLFFYVHFDSGTGLPEERALQINGPVIDYDEVAKEATAILQNLIAIRTIRGDEINAARYFEKLLGAEKIDSEIIHPPGLSNRASLYATLPGSEKENGLVYTNHLDTVEAEETEWSHNPYGGELHSGRIYGRGAIDMKGMAVMELMAFILAKRHNIALKYNLMFLALADEESGSTYGAKFLTRENKNLFEGYSTVINEGGLGTHGIAIKDKTILNIQVADKGILWLKAEARGKSGHGSVPTPGDAAVKLNQFVSEVRNMGADLVISEQTEPFFYQMGVASDFPNSYLLKRAANPLVKYLIKSAVVSNKHLNAMTHNTIALTGLHTTEGSGINVISAVARAKLDIRLLPGVRPNDFLLRVNQIAKAHGIAITVVDSFASNSSPTGSRAFKILSAVASQNYQGATVTPLLSPSFTDNIFLREIGLDCYGFIPVVLTGEELDGLHGKDEHISVENLKMGIKILFETLLAYNNI